MAPLDSKLRAKSFRSRIEGEIPDSNCSTGQFEQAEPDAILMATMGFSR
jgi:hypothetical protein